MIAVKNVQMGKSSTPSKPGTVRRICDIYDFFAPYTNVLTYLLTYCSHCHSYKSLLVLGAASTLSCFDVPLYKRTFLGILTIQFKFHWLLPVGG